ncbi:MAG: hypothetical protein ABEL97_15150 [Salinibacter sp.]
MRIDRGPEVERRERGEREVSLLPTTTRSPGPSTRGIERTGGEERAPPALPDIEPERVFVDWNWFLLSYAPAAEKIAGAGGTER